MTVLPRHGLATGPGDGVDVVDVMPCSTGKRCLQQVLRPGLDVTGSSAGAQRRRVAAADSSNGVSSLWNSATVPALVPEGEVGVVCLQGGMSTGWQNPGAAAEADDPASTRVVAGLDNVRPQATGQVAAAVLLSRTAVDRGVAPLPAAQKWSVARFVKELVHGHGNIVVEGMPGG